MSLTTGTDQGDEDPPHSQKAKAHSCYQASDSDKFLRPLCPQGRAPRLPGWH